MARTCGQAGEDYCCASSLVPAGTFERSNDPMSPATVSDFRLDIYEITVGRFRNFVDAYAPAVEDGAGKNPNDTGDSGWNAIDWNERLPATAAALRQELKCSTEYQTWTDDPGGNEALPINCLTWYEAYAFCIWDGGRLPTEAEWNYAAAGGSEQRLYPWSDPADSTAIDDDHAVYCGGSCSSPSNVGSKSPLGDATWGQADMAGNMWEWTLDSWDTAGYPDPCVDCASSLESTRVVRGGSFFSAAPDLLTSLHHYSNDPTTSMNTVGARCARSP